MESRKKKLITFIHRTYKFMEVVVVVTSFYHSVENILTLLPFK